MDGRVADAQFKGDPEICALGRYALRRVRPADGAGGLGAGASGESLISSPAVDTAFRAVNMAVDMGTKTSCSWCGRGWEMGGACPRTVASS